jgi:hypothetical protein
VARLAGRAALGAGLAAGAMTAAFAANWEVNPGPGGACHLVSALRPVNDGYQEVQARILLEGRAVVVMSDSVLDGGSSDIGLAVANHPLIPMDRIRDLKQAVFEKQYEKIVQLFKEGREVRVQLRFWPTWPATGTHSVSFSLMGFTKAYGEAAGCR